MFQLISTIKFKLTDYGKDVYIEYITNIYKMCKLEGLNKEISKILNDEYKHMQLWEFMNIFGKYIIMGNKIVVEKCQIILEVVDIDEQSSNVQEEIRIKTNRFS